MLPILVIGQGLRTLPIIIQLDAVESKIGKNRRNLLEIIDFLLFCSEFIVRDPL